MNKNKNYREFIKLMNMTAFTLIINLSLYIAAGFLLSVISGYKNVLADDIFYMIYDTADIITYALSFVIPAVVFVKMRRGKIYQSVSYAPTLMAHPIWCILAALGVLQALGYVSDIFFDIFETFGINIYTSYEPYVPQSASGIIMLFISLVIVPAFVEEFLFRGVLLTAFSPYGRAFAVIASGVLFGLMHCSTSQFFYAAIGGIVMAFLTLESGSVWLAVFVHLLNNLFSFIYTFTDAYATVGTNTIISISLTLLILVLGTAGGIFMIRDSRNYSEDKAEIKMIPRELVKGLFAPVMLIYIIFTFCITVSRFM